ncbi:MAG: hypothetical protein JXA15_08080 [Spirochaetales bacterium]|nr:hypothetical protein [Spirochaetales bacterium]
MTRAEWLREQDRRRYAVSWLSSALFYILAATLLVLFGVLRVDQVSEYSGPVRIRIGSAEGLEAEPRPLESPDSTEPAPDVEALPPEKVESAPAPVETAGAPGTWPASASAPSTARAEPKPEPARTAPAAPPVASPVVPQTPPAPPVIKGSEVGNSYETTFEASSGTISRSIYEPVWLYMPLPENIDEFIYRGIEARKDRYPDEAERAKATAELKREFERWYSHSLKYPYPWYSKGEVPLTERPRLWLMLQAAGLDFFKEADYRLRPGLKPVELSFRLTSAGSGNPRLEEVHLVKSSGYPDIDDAVLYGFKQASFSNSADRSVSGRFIYRFEGAR